MRSYDLQTLFFFFYRNVISTKYNNRDHFNPINQPPRFTTVA